MLCNFKRGRAGWYCTRCHKQAGFASDRSPVRNCQVGPCVHLGEQVSAVKVTCTNCRGEKQVMRPVHRCPLHGRCLPTYEPIGELLTEWQQRKPESDIYTLCHLCDDFDAS